eukprot:816551-Rhodomonas_salina.1
MLKRTYPAKRIYQDFRTLDATPKDLALQKDLPRQKNLVSVLASDSKPSTRCRAGTPGTQQSLPGYPLSQAASSEGRTARTHVGAY